MHYSFAIMPIKRAKLITKEGQPSWKLSSKEIEAYITRIGGQIAPVIFDRNNRKISPYSIAPWAKEKLPPNTPNIIRALRGDFFCMPFGSNSTPYQREKHPLHGQPANDPWTFESLTQDRGESTLHLSLRTTIRPGRVDKTITLIDGQPAIYSRHIISELSGPMNFGHHAMLKFPSDPGCGIFSTSKFVRGQVFPDQFENPQIGGYSSLKAGAMFDDLTKVPTADGGIADLTHYPARLGFEDLVMLTTDQHQPMAWSAVSFPKQKYVWFALKDPNVLTQTVLWHSNRGRHYAPWSSRHTGVLGIEDITGNFHFGLAESASPNPISKAGHATSFNFKGLPMTISYIMGCAPTPAGFGAVKSIEPDFQNKKIILQSTSGKAMRLPIHLSFLQLA
jgi:hypothetical protein